VPVVVDDLFRFRFRIDAGVLTIKDTKVPESAARTPFALEGRFTRVEKRDAPVGEDEPKKSKELPTSGQGQAVPAGRTPRLVKDIRSVFSVPRQPARIKNLGSKDSKQAPPKVMIVMDAPSDVRKMFPQVAGQLGDLLGKQLVTMCEENKEKISIVPQRTAEEFKNTHPGWDSLGLAEIRRLSKADYLIHLKIGKLGLFEPNCANQLLRGRANITVTLVDLNNPDDPPDLQEFACTYPGDAWGPIPVDVDVDVDKFRQVFLTHLARQLSLYFEDHSARKTDED
jgi:hypothetical protein